MHDRAVARVSPPQRQGIRKVAVTLEVCTPGHAPEGRGDLSTLDDDGGRGLPFLDPFGHFLRGFGTPLGHGDVGFVVVAPAHKDLLILAILLRHRSPDADPASRIAAAYRHPFRSARPLPTLCRRSRRPRLGFSALSSRRR